MKFLLLRIVAIMLLSLSSYVQAEDLIAIDGANGYVGSVLYTELEHKNVRLGYKSIPINSNQQSRVFAADIRDPQSSKEFLKEVDIYYQMAAITSVQPSSDLMDYILTNAIGPYLSSRINKSMHMVSMSSIAVYDVDMTEKANVWIDKFRDYIHKRISEPKDFTAAEIVKVVSQYMRYNKAPDMKSIQYYGFSKIIMEALLNDSAMDRDGNIYVIRCGFLIGANIRNRQGSSVAKNIMDTIFSKDRHYDVWNRSNYYTPVHKLKEMIFYLTGHPEYFSKHEILDSGYVIMSQHEYVKQIMSKRPNAFETGINLVEKSNFTREVRVTIDDRLKEYYPNCEDVDHAIEEMIAFYREEDD